MSAIREGLRALPWRDEAQLEAAAVALESLLRPMTLVAVGEWLNLPAPAYKGLTVREMIEAGRGDEVVAAWFALGEGVFV